MPATARALDPFTLIRLSFQYQDEQRKREVAAQHAQSDAARQQLNEAALQYKQAALEAKAALDAQKQQMAGNDRALKIMEHYEKTVEDAYKNLQSARVKAIELAQREAKAPTAGAKSWAEGTQEAFKTVAGWVDSKYKDRALSPLEAQSMATAMTADPSFKKWLADPRLGPKLRQFGVEYATAPPEKRSSVLGAASTPTAPPSLEDRIAEIYTHMPGVDHWTTITKEDPKVAMARYLKLYAGGEAEKKAPETPPVEVAEVGGAPVKLESGSSYAGTIKDAEGKTFLVPSSTATKSDLAKIMNVNRGGSWSANDPAGAKNVRVVTPTQVEAEGAQQRALAKIMKAAAQPQAVSEKVPAPTPVAAVSFADKINQLVAHPELAAQLKTERKAVEDEIAKSPSAAKGLTHGVMQNAVRDWAVNVYGDHFAQKMGVKTPAERAVFKKEWSKALEDAGLIPPGVDVGR
jgi:hypothetical protein